MAQLACRGKTLGTAWHSTEQGYIKLGGARQLNMIADSNSPKLNKLKAQLLIVILLPRLNPNELILV